MTTAKRGRPPKDRANRPTRLTAEDELGRGKLTCEGLDPNFVYRVVNDDGARIDYLKQRGYEIVQKDEGITMGAMNPSEPGSHIQTTVDRRTGMKGVLMRQRKEWYEEDRRFKDQQIAKSEEALFRKETEEKGRYGKLEVE